MNKKLVAVFTLCMVMALSMLGCGTSKKDSGEVTEKKVTIEVVHKDGTDNKQEVTTKSAYLIGALEELGLADSSKAKDNYYTEVDGESADTDKEEWWCLTVDGESAITGFEDTPLEDGKTYTLTFTEGW